MFITIKQLTADKHFQFLCSHHKIGNTKGRLGEAILPGNQAIENDRLKLRINLHRLFKQAITLNKGLFGATDASVNGI